MEDNHDVVLGVIEEAGGLYARIMTSGATVGIGSKVFHHYLPRFTEIIKPEAGDIKTLNEMLTFMQWTGAIAGGIGLFCYATGRVYVSAHKNKKGE